MTEGKVNSPAWPSGCAGLDAVNLTAFERQQAKQYLHKADQLVDVLSGLAAGLKRLLAVAILDPLARRGASSRTVSDDGVIRRAEAGDHG